MKRLAIDYLIKWKNKTDRKPLILKGARQVGKTWLLKEFGKTHFKQYHYFDFERDKSQLLPAFEGALSPQIIIRNLSLLFNKTIHIEEDLIIFDEIQNIPKALTSLKYFHEELPQLAICAAGSLLGILLSDISFPVGNVSFYTLRPMSFEEFILNYNHQLLYEAYLSGYTDKMVSTAIHQKLLDVLREFYVSGGMPEIVNTYLQNTTSDSAIFKTIREKQRELVKSLQSDFSKHSGRVNPVHIASVYENIPIQLAQNLDGSVKRFRFKNVIKGKKGYSELLGPISWLTNAELIIKVLISNRAEIPLQAFSAGNFFKLYMNDIGLLGAMLEIPPSAIMLGNYGTTKGYFVENYTAMELVNTSDSQLYSWNERNSEIEFIILKEGRLIPVEVKSGLRTKAKSLQQYLKKYNPDRALVLSEKPLSLENSIKKFIPLYYAGKLFEMDF